MSRHEMPDSKDNKNSDFAFMNKRIDPDFSAYEWEENEKDLERQWYDAEEDGNIHYGTT